MRFGCDADKFSEMILRETTAFGVRRHSAERRKLHERDEDRDGQRRQHPCNARRGDSQPLRRHREQWRSVRLAVRLRAAFGLVPFLVDGHPVDVRDHDGLGRPPHGLLGRRNALSELQLGEAAQQVRRATWHVMRISGRLTTC